MKHRRQFDICKINYSNLLDGYGGFAKEPTKENEQKNKKAGRELIPASTITRPPTAELRDNQLDADTLGSYAELDPIIIDYVEKNRSLSQQTARHPGKDAYIKRILSMIDRNEYKRRQAPPGIKITPRSFGRDHRMPITNKYS